MNPPAENFLLKVYPDYHNIVKITFYLTFYITRIMIFLSILIKVYHNISRETEKKLISIYKTPLMRVALKTVPLVGVRGWMESWGLLFTFRALTAFVFVK